MVYEDRLLNARILILGASGQIEPDAVVALLHVASGGPMMIEAPNEVERASGLDTICQTLDSNGDTLVAGKNYMLGEQKVKVLRERFGAGNVLCTYQRVFYLGSDLEEHFISVEGRHPNGLFSVPVYKSTFKPIGKEE